MKTSVFSVGMISFVALSGCVSPSEPIVSDFNGDSVKIAQFNYMGEGGRHAGTDAEAARICGKQGKKAEYASVRYLPDSYAEHLYLCL